MKNVTLRAEERHDDLYAGIDLVTSKLERQVRKYKTRVNRKHKTHGEPEAFVAEVQEDRQKLLMTLMLNQQMIVKLRLSVLNNLA